MKITKELAIDGSTVTYSVEDPCVTASDAEAICGLLAILSRIEGLDLPEMKQAAYDPLRGTGRTTSLMLKAIADALAKPGEWIEFVDHYQHTATTAHEHMLELERIAKVVGVRIVTCRQGSRVSVLSLLPGKMMDVPDGWTVG